MTICGHLSLSACGLVVVVGGSAQPVQVGMLEVPQQCLGSSG